MAKKRRKRSVNQVKAKKEGKEGKEEKPKNDQFALDWELLKNHLPYLVLIGIIILAFNLRAYHLDYPVIGYHNWKETHYLSEARNFADDGFFQKGFFVPVSDLPYLDADPSGAHPDTFPMASIMTGVFFKIFGPKLIVARLLNILFGLGTIIALFFLIKMLFKRTDLALTAAFIAAINPLFIYFSHNVQLVNEGVFFMLMAPIFLIKWIEKYDITNAILTCLFFTLAVLTKFTFAVILIPILFIFPWSRLKDLMNKKLLSKNLKMYVPSAIILAFIPLWLYYTDKILTKRFNVGSVGGGIASVNFAAAFAENTRRALSNYLRENFGAWNTFHVAWLALAGAALFLLFYLMKPKSRSNIGNKFIIGYILGAIAWYFVMAEKLSGHNYHQFPVAPLIIFFIAYLFVIVAFNFELLVTTLIRLKTINQYLKGILRYVPLIILVILLIGPSQRSANAMFDTQFRGVDVAGEFIKANSQPDERFFHSSHQSFGSIWHADRIGYRPPQNLSQLQWAEENLNVKWLFLYQWGLYGGISYIPALLQIPETSDYIQANYSLRQIGLERNADQWAPVYFLFQKGGSTNLSNLQAIIGNVQPQVIQYEYSYGEVDFGVINLG